MCIFDYIIQKSVEKNAKNSSKKTDLKHFFHKNEEKINLAVA